VVEAAFKSKVLDGSLEEGCITRAVVSHEDAVKQLFPSLMSMAAAFVRIGQVRACSCYSTLLTCRPLGAHCYGSPLIHFAAPHICGCDCAEGSQRCGGTVV
jgi:hypothetical protein